MRDSRTYKLHQLLKRLGQAVNGSVVNSDEGQACLHELHRTGWDGVMLLEASLVCREDGSWDGRDASVHIHVDPSQTQVAYRINAHDAHFLHSLGISPSRHRAQPSPVRSDREEPEELS